MTWSSARSGSMRSTRRSRLRANNMPKNIAKTVYVLNGPNLNSLGTREPEKYGSATIADVEALCRETGKRFGLDVDFRQSNHEGAIIDSIHEAKAKKAAGI